LGQKYAGLFTSKANKQQNIILHSITEIK